MQIAKDTTALAAVPPREAGRVGMATRVAATETLHPSRTAVRGGVDGVHHIDMQEVAPAVAVRQGVGKGEGEEEREAKETKSSRRKSMLSWNGKGIPRF